MIYSPKGLYKPQRKDEADNIRHVRKILRGQCDCSACQVEADREHLPSALTVIGFIMIASLLFIFSCRGVAHAAEVNDEQAVRTIIGEASNQGEIGMVAVAEVIRARGSLKGIYGLHAAHVDHEPVWVWKMARRAWKTSKTSHLTHGADHFENIHAFGCPSWVKHCVETFRYRDHVFYKEVA